MARKVTVAVTQSREPLRTNLHSISRQFRVLPQLLRLRVIYRPALLISRFSPCPVVRPINPESITASFHLSHAFNVICVFSYRIEQKVRRSKRSALYEKEVLRSRDALCLSLGLQYQDHMLYGPNGRNKVCGYVIVSCTLHLFHTIHKSLQDVRLPISREWRWNVADIAEILAVSTGGHRWEHTIPP